MTAINADESDRNMGEKSVLLALSGQIVGVADISKAAVRI
jgi:hypothetical protein